MSLLAFYDGGDPDLWGPHTNAAFWFFRDGRPRSILARVHAVCKDPTGRGLLIGWTDGCGQLSEASCETAVAEVRSVVTEVWSPLSAGLWAVTVDVPVGMPRLHPMDGTAFAQLEVPIAYELLRASGAIERAEPSVILTGDIHGRHSRFSETVRSTVECLGMECETTLDGAICRQPGAARGPRR